MTDRFRFDLAPSAEFADRLEHRLLRVIGERAPGRTRTTTDTTDQLASEEHLMRIDLEPRPDQTRRAVPILAGAAAVVLLLAGIAWLATRDVGDEAAGAATHTFDVTWAYSDVVSECPDAPDERICLNHFEIPATARFDGDVVGDGNQVVLWNNPADYPGQAVDHLEHVVTYNVAADVTGCGSGEFMLVEIMQFVSGADRDRDTGTYVGTWQIVDESGRGDLAAINGSGTSSGVFGTAQDVGRTFTGTITCP